MNARILTRSGIALLFVALPLVSAHAAPPPPAAAAAKDDDDDDDSKTAAPDPSGKLYQKFEMQRGFYIGSDLGVFLVFGGASRSVSNLQPYIGINVGYDFTSWFSWQAHIGRGFAADAARSANEDSRGLRDFAFTNILTGPVIWLRVWERLAIELKVQGGLAIMDPVPLDPTIDGKNIGGVEPVIGGGVALKYLTLLTDFTLGLDITFNYIIPAAIPSLSVSPTVRYTF